MLKTRPGILCCCFVRVRRGISDGGPVLELALLLRRRFFVKLAVLLVIVGFLLVISALRHQSAGEIIQQHR